MNNNFLLNKNDIAYMKAIDIFRSELIKLINNTNDPILQTFERLWSDRRYWELFPPVIAVHKYNCKVVGVHAYTINSDKYPDMCKTYYIVVDPKFRGKHIAKTLHYYMMIDCYMNNCDNYYVNCADTCDGYKFYKKLGLNIDSKTSNEFGGKDYHFKIKLNKLKQLLED